MDVVAGLPIFVDIYNFIDTLLHAHIEKHTHKLTCMPNNNDSTPRS